MVALGSLFVTSSAAVLVVPSQVVKAVVTPIGAVGADEVFTIADAVAVHPPAAVTVTV